MKIILRILLARPDKLKSIKRVLKKHGVRVEEKNFIPTKRKDVSWGRISIPSSEKERIISDLVKIEAELMSKKPKEIFMIFPYEGY